MIRLLHVDDEDDIREVVALALALDPDFDVRSVGSGRAALAILDDFRPDIILLDVMMPEMDGPSAFKEMRRTSVGAGVRVIFMTARVQQSEIAHLEAMGALGVIAKPFDPMTLASQVRAFVG